MSHQLDPDHAPTPFSADEIRLGCPPGRTVTTRHVPPDGEPYLGIAVFLKHTDDGAHQEYRTVTLTGEPIEAPRAYHTTWSDLQRHASFLALDTTITEEVITTPMGNLDCLRYDVRRDDSLHSFWFAPELPGMPVRMKVVGPHLFSMEMVSTSIG